MGPRDETRRWNLRDDMGVDRGVGIGCRLSVLGLLTSLRWLLRKESQNTDSRYIFCPKP